MSMTFRLQVILKKGFHKLTIFYRRLALLFIQ